jgi:hypothetical protein
MEGASTSRRETARELLMHPGEVKEDENHGGTNLLSCFTRTYWNNLLVRHPQTCLVCGLVFLLMAVTAIVVPLELNDLKRGTPPMCSKGGAAAVFNPPGEDPYLLIYSGQTRKSLWDATKKYDLSKRVWHSVSPKGDEHSADTGTKPLPRWKASAVMVNDTTMAVFGGYLVNSKGEQVPQHDLVESNELWLLHMGGRDEGKNNRGPSWKHINFGDNSNANMKFGSESLGGKTDPATIVPSSRRSHAASKSGDWMYVFGGKRCTDAEDTQCTDLGDLWRLHLKDFYWEKLYDSRLATHPGPLQRHGHSAIAASLSSQDPSDEYFIVYAGRNSTNYLNDIWAWNVNSNAWEDWTPMQNDTSLNGQFSSSSSNSSFPVERNHHSAAFVDVGPLSDANNNDDFSSYHPKMLIFGGKGDPGKKYHQHKTAGILGDLWEFDLVSKTWKEIVPVSDQKPSGRFLTDFTQYNSTLLIFGGDDDVLAGGRLDDLWEYDMVGRTWKELYPNQGFSKSNC